MRPHLTALAVVLALAGPALAAPDPQYRPQPWPAKAETFKREGRIGGATFYATAPKGARPVALRALRFAAGRPPGWLARGWFPATPGEVRDGIFLSTIMPAIRSVTVVEPVPAAPGAAPARWDEPSRLIADHRVSVDSPAGHALTRADHVADAAALARLAKLAPGRYRLVTTFALTYDAHTDGPSWDAARTILAQGVLPVEVTPAGR